MRVGFKGGAIDPLIDGCRESEVSRRVIERRHVHLARGWPQHLTVLSDPWWPDFRANSEKDATGERSVSLAKVVL